MRDFTDYYALLHVDPRCDTRILEVAYHHFAKLYHPDHAATADIDRFSKVVEAYKILKDPEKRAEYDRDHARWSRARSPSAEQPGPGGPEIPSALGDAEVHEKILLYLYRRRRENPDEAGAGPLTVQHALQLPATHFDFHVWYLKSKGFIELTEQGTLAATVAGIDHVIAVSRQAAQDDLRLSRSREAN